MTFNRPVILILALAAVACGDRTRSVVAPEPEDPAAAADSYLCEPPPTTEAVVFAPGTVSVAGRYEYAMSIHPDGDRLLFTVEVPDRGAAVYQSLKEHGAWSVPAPVDLTGGARKHEMEAFFSPDGGRVFFAPYAKGMDVRIWTAEVTPTGFQHPQPLEGPIAADPSFYPVQAVDGSLFYTNLAQRAIFRAELDGGRVTSAGPAGLEMGGHAFPSPDGRFILFDSASLDTEDQRDIYVAFSNDDGSWGPPRRLGTEVNTEFSETCPALSPDGRFLFFSRYNEPGGISDLYWVSSEVIELVAPV